MFDEGDLSNLGISNYLGEGLVPQKVTKNALNPYNLLWIPLALMGN